MPKRKNKQKKNSVAPMDLSANTASNLPNGAAMNTSESGAQKQGSIALNSGQPDAHSIVEGQGNAENQSNPTREFMSMMMRFMQQQAASQEAKAAASKASILQQATALEAMSEEIQRLRYKSAHASSQASALSPPSPLPKDCSSSPVNEGSLSAFPIVKNKRNKRTQQFCQFIKLKPPHFSGTDNPLDAEAWMEQVVKALKVSGCDTQYWVCFVIYVLEGEAGQWWSSVSSRIKQPIVWEDFVKEFYEKFFPSWYRKRQEMEFLQLEQGSMTVTQYETKFSALSRFALHLIADEEKKVKKFENGLRAELKDKVQVFYCSTYEEVVKKAMIIEEGKLDHKALTAPLLEETAARLAIALGKRKVATNSYSPTDHEGRVRPRRKPFQLCCYRCGNVGHIIRNCHHIRQEKLYQPTDAGAITTNSPPQAETSSSPDEGDFASDKKIGCYRCGEFDHFIRDCPFRNCPVPRQQKPRQSVDASSITTANPPQVVVPCSSTEMSSPVNATTTCAPLVVVSSSTKMSVPVSARLITTTCPPQIEVPCSSIQLSMPTNSRSITNICQPQVMVPCSSTQMSVPVNARSITTTCPPLVTVSSSSTKMSGPVSTRLITTTCPPQSVVPCSSTQLPMPVNLRSITTTSPPQVVVPCSSTQTSRPINSKSITTICTSQVAVPSSTQMSRHVNVRSITTTCPPQSVLPCSSTQMSRPDASSITTTRPSQMVVPSSTQLSTAVILSEGDCTLDSKIRCNRGEPNHILRNFPCTIQGKIHLPADSITATSLPQAATPSPPTQFPSLGEPARIQPDRPVAWRPPRPGTVRLNVDGCSRGNPGPSAVGGIFRDHCGKVLAAFGSFLGSHDSLYVELMAILKGLICASQLGFSSLEVESDSLAVVDWVTSTNEFWGFAYLIKSIRQLTQQHQIQIKHVPKEANQAADFMANWACTYHITNLFTGTDGLPSGLLDITTFDAKKLSHL